jgi:hypothetical protein
MHRVFGKHPAQVSFPEDQHPVGDFGADGQHEALGEAVRSRTTGRDLDHLDARIRQDREGGEPSRAEGDGRFLPWTKESEPLEELIAYADWIVHVQLADTGRNYPVSGS